MLGKRKDAEQERIDTLSARTEVRGTMMDSPITVLSADTFFKGSLTFDKSLRIEGTFEGEITTVGALYIGKDAKVKAEIKVGSAFIDGNVTGNITANEKIELHATAKVLGDLKASKMVVEEGASLVGHCEVSPKTPEKDLSYSKGLGDFLGKSPVEAAPLKK